MSMTDPISDMLTRIRNAGSARLRRVDIPASGMKTEIAKVMKAEGYIKDFQRIDDNKQGILRIYLKYGPDQQHVIFEMKRVSKPSRRVYVKASDLKPVYNGTGVGILTTSKGVLTDRAARMENIGGEYLCTLW
jgi:small subunit ribosomal protein S8